LGRTLVKTKKQKNDEDIDDPICRSRLDKMDGWGNATVPPPPPLPPVVGLVDSRVARDDDDDDDDDNEGLLGSVEL